MLENASRQGPGGSLSTHNQQTWVTAASYLVHVPVGPLEESSSFSDCQVCHTFYHFLAALRPQTLPLRLQSKQTFSVLRNSHGSGCGPRRARHPCSASALRSPPAQPGAQLQRDGEGTLSAAAPRLAWSGTTGHGVVVYIFTMTPVGIYCTTPKYINMQDLKNAKY